MFWLKTCVSSSSRAKKALNETLNYQFLCTLYGFEPPFFPRTFCKKIYFLNVIRIVVFVTLSFRCCTMLFAVRFKGKYWWFRWMNYIYLSWYLIINNLSRILFGVDLSNYQNLSKKNKRLPYLHFHTFARHVKEYG